MPVVNARPEHEGKSLLAEVRVDAVVHAAFPNGIAEEVEAAGIAALEVRFGEAVAFLLAQVAANRRATVMPNDGAGMINDLPVRDEQTPAEVNVVAGGTVLRVERADNGERVLAKSHVAARDVFCAFVVHEHARWISRRLVNAPRNEAVLGRRKVRSAHG